jgi:hypothetical protein
MKVVILGMAVGNDVGEGGALEPTDPSSAGGRLWAMAREFGKLTPENYAAAFERINLVEGKWSGVEAKKAAPAMKQRLRGRVVVVLGMEVWTYMALPKRPKEIGVGVSGPDGTTYYAVPHPSGKCLTYNDEENKRNVGLLLGQLARRMR